MSERISLHISSEEDCLFEAGKIAGRHNLDCVQKGYRDNHFELSFGSSEDAVLFKMAAPFEVLSHDEFWEWSLERLMQREDDYQRQRTNLAIVEKAAEEARRERAEGGR